MFLKVIACEIFFREVSHLAARSKNIIEPEFLTQGYHDIPKTGCAEIQKRLDAVPAGKFDGILLGYGLCSNILTGLSSAHTPVVIPRAHDCITHFLGSRARYQELFSERPGTYYYTSGWLECLKRRGDKGPVWGGASLPAGAGANVRLAYEEWVTKYGEEQARYLLEVMDQWTQGYTHGVLINFDFLRNVGHREQVQGICANRNWQYEEMEGDLGLLERWLEGDWGNEDFLVLKPGQKVVPTFDHRVIDAVPV
jgi:hypothetical protein